MKEGMLWQMCIHRNSGATICPASVAKIQDLRNWSEDICSLKVFVTEKTMLGFQENRISFFQNIRQLFL